MKKFSLLILLMPFVIKAQIVIGFNPTGNDDIQLNSPGSIFGFVDNCTLGECENTKGIILPVVEVNASESDTNGTFIFDGIDRKIKVFENNSWKNLSYLSGDVSNVIADDFATEIGQGVVVKDNLNDNNPIGVLVLESDTKALRLPRISNPIETVENPYPGMICYDIDSKSLVVFDGKYWNIWKEKINQ